VKLHEFSNFEDTVQGLQAATALQDGSVSDPLQAFLKKSIVKAGIKEQLGVAELRLGGAIKKALGIECRADALTAELLRCVRAQFSSLVPDVSAADERAMSLGLAHSLSRFKLKFSPDKIDTMIVQAISLLDDLDKEINIYAMRVREWYGWHFPEMSAVVSDNLAYARVVKKMGARHNALETDLSDVLPADLIERLQQQAQVSMGTEVSEHDIENIIELCDQVLSIAEYREQLYDYLRNRMQAIAPNLTTLVGELVGARLIANAGSLLSLAKYPASTIQILGAEKALFRALKTKSDTPKYGLIYHASIVGQAAPKNKGKMSRILGAKCALSIRVDALSDKDSVPSTIGIDDRAKIEQRLRLIDGGVAVSQLSGTSKKTRAPEAYQPPTTSVKAYSTSSDARLADAAAAATDAPAKKRKADDADLDTDDKAEKADKKEKKAKKEKKEEKKEKHKEKKEKKHKDDDDGSTEKKEKKKSKKSKE
jgi:nucleolar protein 58